VDEKSQSGRSTASQSSRSASPPIAQRQAEQKQAQRQMMRKDGNEIKKESPLQLKRRGVDVESEIKTMEQEEPKKPSRLQQQLQLESQQQVTRPQIMEPKREPPPLTPEQLKSKEEKRKEAKVNQRQSTWKIPRVLSELKEPLPLPQPPPPLTQQPSTGSPSLSALMAPALGLPGAHGPGKGNGDEGHTAARMQSLSLSNSRTAKRQLKVASIGQAVASSGSPADSTRSIAGYVTAEAKAEEERILAATKGRKNNESILTIIDNEKEQVRG
jgi:hypothetical protein